jgi:hypothetical protein
VADPTDWIAFEATFLVNETLIDPALFENERPLESWNIRVWNVELAAPALKA